MADEEKTEETESEEAVEETPAEAPAEEAAEAPDEGQEPDAEPQEEAPAEEPVAEEAPAEEPAAEEPGAAGEPEPEEALSPKQIRKRERSRHTGEAKPPRTAEERATEREERRQRAAANRRRYRERQRSRRGEPGTGTPPAEREPGSKKVRQGRVVSAKADKTITVRIDVVRRHPQYDKVVRRSATLHAHDAENAAQEGDTVRVVETRPLSRTKRWRLVEVLERAR